jgi:hypothetical protein
MGVAETTLKWLISANLAFYGWSEVIEDLRAFRSIVHVDQQLSYINIFMQKIIEKLDETIARLDGTLAENNKAPTL